VCVCAGRRVGLLIPGRRNAGVFIAAYAHEMHYCREVARALLKREALLAAIVHMSMNTGNAPAWLFSFLDLAFLIMIALLHTTDSEPVPTPELALVELPEIERSVTTPLSADAAAQWHVRVHPRRTPDDTAAFSLVANGGEGASQESLATNDREVAHARLAGDELGLALTGLRERSDAKPLLAPHRDSRSEDFLTALAFVQRVWPDSHSAAVRPQTTPPAVSAAPMTVVQSQ
jgi:hypothetical protein